MALERWLRTVPSDRQRSVAPSSLSLLGLARHMAEVERNWFRRVLAGENAPSRYGSERTAYAECRMEYERAITPYFSIGAATRFPHSVQEPS
jgi:hypothetical protein